MEYICRIPLKNSMHIFGLIIDDTQPLVLENLPKSLRTWNIMH